MKPQDKDFRYEKKFVIHKREYPDVEHILRTSPLILSEVYWRRRVNSLYFDTPSYKNYEEHLAGMSERLKIRVRWYGRTFGKAADPRLEVKMKHHEWCRKLSFKLQSFYVGKDLSMHMMKEIFRAAHLPPWLDEALQAVEPVLITSYHRRYFMSKCWNCRITLDDNLVFYSFLVKTSLTTETSDDGLFILELKCPVNEYDRLCTHASLLPFRMTAYSKYITGMQLSLMLS